MTEAVQLELIKALTVIVPSAISGVAAVLIVVVGNKVDKVSHAMNSLLDKRVQEAHTLGTSEGRAAGVEQERNRS